MKQKNWSGLLPFHLFTFANILGYCFEQSRPRDKNTFKSVCKTEQGSNNALP